jgi:hypothetical protein
MTRLVRAWSAMSRERRLAGVAAVALLVTMFFPWYGLQSVGPKGVIYSHNINAFGDISFVEAAIFLVAAGVIALLLARAEGRNFNLPGGDGTIVAIAGGWSTLLIFYRVFSRPSGHGYPVGIQWGFFLAFVAAGSLAYAGWRMRHGERPEAPIRRHSQPRPPGGPAEERGATERGQRDAPHRAAPSEGRREETGETALVPVAAARRSAEQRQPAPAPPPARRERPRFPPRPDDPEQLSFEDPPPGGE